MDGDRKRERERERERKREKTEGACGEERDKKTGSICVRRWLYFGRSSRCCCLKKKEKGSQVSSVGVGRQLATPAQTTRRELGLPKVARTMSSRATKAV